MSVIAERLEHMRPGERARGALHVGKMASGQPLDLPYHIARGRSPHPCLWINATVHGNEIPGTLATIEFFRRLDPAALDGSVVVTPISNPLGVDQRVKNSFIDGTDLDQSFPGRPFLTTERTAGVLFAEVAPAVDAAVNVHTMGPFMDAVPYCVYKTPPDDRVSEQQLLRLSACFEPFVACRMDLGGGGELPGNIAGAFDYQVLKLGKPALMLELGAGGRWDAAYIDQGARGMERVAAQIGVMQGSPQAQAGRPPVRLPEEQAGRTLLRVTRRAHVTCGDGGFFCALVTPGQRLARGQCLGEIENVYGDDVERVTLPEDALIIGVRRDPVVHVGDRVGFVAYEWDEVPIA